MYIKLIGCMLVAVSGLSVTYILNKRASSALICAEGGGELITRIKTEIECFALPIGDILSRIDPSIFERCGYTGSAPPKDLHGLLEKTLFTDAETERQAVSFVSEFGRCYKNEQVERCSYFMALMEERRRKLASELPSKQKLNATLSLAAGLGAIILFM